MMQIVDSGPAAQAIMTTGGTSNHMMAANNCYDFYQWPYVSYYPALHGVVYRTPLHCTDEAHVFHCPHCAKCQCGKATIQRS